MEGVIGVRPLIQGQGGPIVGGAHIASLPLNGGQIEGEAAQIIQVSLMNRVLSVASFVLLTASVVGQQYPFLPVAGSPKSVKSLFQDSRGRLWLGGPQAACFDGTRFFALRDYGFPAAEAYDFSEDPSGAIWIGAETGVYRFANGKVEEVGKGVAS